MVSLSIYFTLLNQLINLILPSIYHSFTNPPFALPIYPPAFSVTPLPLQPSNNLLYTHPSIHSSINPSIICPSPDLPISPLIHSSVTYSSISPSTQSSYTPTPVPIHPFTSLSIHLTLHPCICLFMCSFALSSTHPPIHPPIHLCGHPFASPSTYLHAQNSVSPRRILQNYCDTSASTLGPRNPILMPLFPYSLAYTEADLS